MKILTLPLSLIGIGLVKIYQRTKTRHYSKCLHFPSCSNYALLALRKYSFFKAVWISVKRYRDCHPFSNRPYVDYP
ncbi:membrane protein insertion efficiency factor YidD [Dinghuibacter silviterrae]|uniref:Membrane protein insertion efficiency factor n=1 Tax=Dinghuibacter silviterrae TaxID=1539049 RepID=A0A4R8DPR6_9BACT|nr:hypothetical protein EDB95_0756 [Dinghuibacter silviterrae]